MDGTVYTALVSGAVALGVVVLSNYYGRKRDHEADWRKMKLEYYREYLLALSRVVGRDSDATAQRRYADAANGLILVAPSNLLIALHAFQNEVRETNKSHDPLKAESLLNVLMRNMRKDCHPQTPKDNQKFIFRILDIPSDKAANNIDQSLYQEK
jgi:hypothetical protein